MKIKNKYHYIFLALIIILPGLYSCSLPGDSKDSSRADTSDSATPDISGSSDSNPDEQSSPPDTLSPTMPENLNGQSVSNYQIELQWTAATDNVGVAGYRVYRDSHDIGTTENLNFTDIGLGAGTLYEYKITAFDAAGNESVSTPVILLTTTNIVSMGAPVLLFSDLTSGPQKGNSDTAGGLQASEHGTIITIWGQNLGASQNSSRVLIGNQDAAHIYYWKNADGQSPGGPANLFKYHKMQEIAFSVPAVLANGLHSISVRINGETGSGLSFTVRDGKIFYVRASGNNSTGDGSWQNPWHTLNYVGDDDRNQNGDINAGDIIYIVDSFTEDGGVPLRYSGTSDAPVALVGYPGSDVLLTGAYNNISTIVNWYQQHGYWYFSKFTINTPANGMSAFTDMRVTGLEFTGPQAEGAGGVIGCGEANIEAIDGTCGGGKFYGMYVHDFGDDNTSEFHHTTYISNRDGLINKAYEFGWNYFHDNKAVHGFHIYDQSPGGDWSGTMKIHDNVVVNQKGPAVNLMSGGTSISVPVDIYNNIFINCGIGPDITKADSSIFVVPKYAISLSEGTITSHVRIYNNIIYGYGQGTSGVAVNKNFGGTLDLKNNIIVDTNDLNYVNGTPEQNSNNLFYNGGDSTPLSPPAWAVSALSGDPLFVNPGQGNFSLQENSPAVDKGSSEVNVLTKYGFINVSRPQGNGYDIGSFER
jgi:hypothetical protein